MSSSAARRGMVAVALVGCAAVGCSTVEAGHPRPAPAAMTTVTSGPGAPPNAPAVTSVEELDLCALLGPDDFPVDAAPGDVPLKLDEAEACAWTISIDNAGSVFSAGVGAQAVPFSRYLPSPISPNGRYTEISGRRAWLGNPFRDVGEGCSAAFGSADGFLTVTVGDYTGRGVDPCVTATGLAELVIARTPPPDE